MKKLLVNISLLIALIAIVIVSGCIQQSDSEQSVRKFSSYTELENYVKNNIQYTTYYGGIIGKAVVPMMDVSTESGSIETSGSTEYSSTNIQVQGVNEADIVKNDGRYIYTIVGSNVVIVDAYPADHAKILSEIGINGTPSEILVDNDRLVIFGSRSGYELYTGVICIRAPCPGSYYYKTFIDVYDITDRSNPVLVKNITMNGNYFDSRMIGDNVYAVINNPVQLYNDRPIQLPVIETDGIAKEIAAVDIYYFDYPDTSYQFTTILSLNVNTGATDEKTYMMGYTQDMFVSMNNIYITYQKRVGPLYILNKMIDDVILPNVPNDLKAEIIKIRDSSLSVYDKESAVQDALNKYSESFSGDEKAEFAKRLQDKITEFQKSMQKEMEKTVIHKIAIADGKIDYKVQSEVPGNVLNQFSMDEYDGKFRIATTTEQWSGSSKNNLYVLDESMKIIGKVEDLASGERIYSVRFVGTRAFMVTFRQIDPLFVIDLSDSADPKVLGFLKIPGVSDYMHAYDENHIIGVGRDATDEGRIIGVKLSLFDVTDPTNPREISKYAIGDRGTSTPVTYDHKAFLFSKEKNLLVIPISLYEKTNASQEWPQFTWQGVFVFNIDLENGFVVTGKVTHNNETAIEVYYPYYGASITRSLYIDNVLYTISNRMIKANSLDDMQEINKIDLPFKEDYYPRPLYAEDAVVSEGVVGVK